MTTTRTSAPNSTTLSGAATPLFRGDGEMAARCRSLDWSATPLGPVESWPSSLRTIAGVVLETGFPSIVLWGPRLVQIYNDGYMPFLGVKHPRGLGMPSHECWPEVKHLTMPIYDRVFAGETVTNEEQLYKLLRHGPDAPPDDVYITLSFSPIRDENGGVAGVFVMLMDTTAQVTLRRAQVERERMLEESETARVALIAARQEAESASRAKSEFLAVMSHELRTPLNAIDGYAELMELGIRGPITELQREDLHRIRTSQRHLLGLINGVLNYSRIEAGAVSYKREPVVMDDVLVACEALTSPQVHARGLSMHLEDCDRGLVAKADPEKVQQVLLNLISNAIKFTEPGGTITLGCHRDRGGVALMVEDTGDGIATDHLESIFQPFVQLDARLTRTHEGTGLGLAISRDLARGMGGDLTVRSAPGEGSKFMFTLPAA